VNRVCLQLNVVGSLVVFPYVGGEITVFHPTRTLVSEQAGHKDPEGDALYLAQKAAGKIDLMVRISCEQILSRNPPPPPQRSGHSGMLRQVD